MVGFQYPTEVNLNIVNMDSETSVSTSFSEFIAFTKNGLMYTIGDYEQLSSVRRAIKCLKLRGSAL